MKYDIWPYEVKNQTDVNITYYSTSKINVNTTDPIVNVNPTTFLDKKTFYCFIKAFSTWTHNFDAKPTNNNHSNKKLNNNNNNNNREK